MGEKFRVLTEYIGSESTIEIPNGVVKIGDRAFENNDEIERVVLSESVEEIGNSAFGQADKLKSVQFSPKLRKIGAFAFNHCRNLEKVNFPDGLEEIGRYAFGFCWNLKGDLILPNSILTIGDHAFYECSKLSGELVLPENLSELCEYVFGNCSGFTGQVNVPSSVTKISAGAFLNMNQIESIVFEGPVADIYSSGSSPFAAMTELVSIQYLSAETPKFRHYDLFEGCPNLQTIIVPYSELPRFLNDYCLFPTGARLVADDVLNEWVISGDTLRAYVGSEADVVIPENIRENIRYIGPGAFRNNKNIESIDLPPNLEQIGNKAFQGCERLKEQTFPDSLTRIGDLAYEKCCSLQTINLSDSNLITLGAYCFSECSSLDIELNLPETLTSLRPGIFFKCSNLKGSVVVPDSVTEVGNGFISHSPLISEMNFGKGLTYIGPYDTFDGMNGLKTVTFNSITVPENVEILRKCPNLERIYVPAESYSDYSALLSPVLSAATKLRPIGVDTDFLIQGDILQSYLGDESIVSVPEEVRIIGKSAFQNNITLKSVVLSNTLTQIEDRAFKGCSNLEEVILNSKVEMIGTEAFMDCTSLISIDLPDALRSIEDGCFKNNTFLQRVEIKGNVESLGDQAFMDCTSLTSIDLPGSLESIGKECFKNNAAMQNVDMKNNVSSLGDQAFMNCTSLTSIRLSESIEKIGKECFYKCSSMAGSVRIPELTKSIGERCFKDCENLEQIILDCDLEVLPMQCFQNCTKLVSVVGIESQKNLKTVGAYAFENCLAWDEDLQLPNSLQTINEGAFKNCKKLSGLLKFENEVTRIDTEAFRYTNFTDVVITATLEYIGRHAFYDMNQVELFDIGCSSKSLSGFEVFYSPSVKQLILRHSSPPNLNQVRSGENLERIEVEIGAFRDFCLQNYGALTDKIKVYAIGYNENLLIYEDTVLGYYGADDNIIIPENVRCIAPYAFRRSNLRSLTLPDSLEIIDPGAFMQCNVQEGEVQLPEGLKSIGNRAFCSFSGLGSEVIIPEGVHQLNSDLFYGDDQIKHLKVLGDLEEIQDNSFRDITNLEVLELHSKIRAPFRNNNYDFVGTKKLTVIKVPRSLVKDYKLTCSEPGYFPFRFEQIEPVSQDQEFIIDEDGTLYGYVGSSVDVVIPPHVKTIGTRAFYDEPNIRSVTLPDDIVAINDRAFGKCKNLERVNIPDAVRHIGAYAFEGCKSLKSIHIPKNIQFMGASVFKDCVKATGDLVFPSSLTGIPNSAFANCSSLRTLTFRNGVQYIGSYAFEKCTSLSGNLILPDSLNEIDSFAFLNCKFDGILSLPSSGCDISYSAFRKISGLKGELIMPKDPDYIPNDYSFYDFSKIDRVVFPNSTISFKSSARHAPLFFGMTGVTELVFTSNTPLKIEDENISWLLNQFERLKRIHVPARYYEEYFLEFSPYLNQIEMVKDPTIIPIEGLIASKIYSTKTLVAWNPHPSQDIVQYQVYKDGTEVGSTTNCTMEIDSLVPGQIVTITVVGITSENERTEPAEIEIQTPIWETLKITNSEGYNSLSDFNNSIQAVVDPKAPVHISQIDDVHGNFYLVNDNKIDRIGIANIEPELDENGSLVFETEWEITNFEDGDYTIRFVLEEPSGEVLSSDAVFNVLRQQPHTVEGLSYTEDPAQILLSWRIAKDVNVSGYKLYRKGIDDTYYHYIQKVQGRGTLSTADANVTANGVYYYRISAVNEAGVESELSEPLRATLSSDKESPVVMKMQPQNSSYLSKTINLTITGEDNIGIERYEAWLSLDNRETWQKIGEASGKQSRIAFDTTPYPDGQIYVKILAYDEAENVSEPLIYTYALDNTAPSKVENVTYDSTSVSITLHWNAMNEEDIRCFSVQKKNSSGEYVRIAQEIKTLGYTVEKLRPNTEYTFRVLATDIHGNTGEPSDEIVCMTQGDTTAPVITRLRPLAGSYSSEIEFTVSAQDDDNIVQICIEGSSDGETWNEIASESFTDVKSSREMKKLISLKDIAEGHYYLRAVAADNSGNVSDTSAAAPFVQYLVDHTAPAGPEGVMSQVHDGVIEISWKQGTESDLSFYSVYRSETENGEYEKIAEKLKNLNYLDRSIQSGKTYYYKVAVQDEAGNLSELSAPVSGSVEEDTEKPVIIGQAPDNGERIGTGYKKIRILAEDNRALKQMIFQYSADGITYQTFQRMNVAASSRHMFETVLPIERYSDASNMYIRVQAVDVEGNSSDPVDLMYTVDKSAPTITNLQASWSDGKVIVSWTSGQESDLSGYQVFRREKSSAKYVLAGQRKADGSYQYSFDDYGISDAGGEYIYKLVSMDDCGNTAEMTAGAIFVPSKEAGDKPVAVLNCESIMEAGTQYYIDATLSTDNTGIETYLIDFGDGTQSTLPRPIHVYENPGKYMITLTVTDKDGNEATVSKEVEVRAVNQVGTAKIKVVDENNKPVPNAPVYFDLGSENQIVKNTDQDGFVTFSADAGRYMVGCLIANNEWLPAKREMIVTAGMETAIYLRMVHQPMLEGQFEVKRLTFEEIKNAGIDISKPENQYMLEVKVKLTYGKEVIDTSFLYNETTGLSLNRPCFITVDSNPRQIVCQGHKIQKPDDPNQYDIAVAVLDIPVGASCLKEFFDVKLHIINNASSEFVMENNTVSLHLPEGLSLMNADGYSAVPSVTIPSIPGQSQKTISWLIRGDEAGEYDLSADVIGTIMPFNETMTMEFQSPEKIKVYGLSDLKLTVYVDKTIENDTFYFDLGLSNMGEIDINMPSVHVVDDIVDAYLAWEEKDEEGNPIEGSEERKLRVSVLNTIIENASGAHIDLGKQGTVDVLAPGETLLRKYAAYHAATFKNDFALKEMAKIMAEGYGMQFEIIEKDIVQFSLDNAKEKVEEIASNPEKSSALDSLLDEYSYFYVREALEWDHKYLDMDPADIYEPAYAQMKMDEVFGQENSKALVREYIRLLQIDGSWQQSADASVNKTRKLCAVNAVKAIADSLKEDGLLSEADASKVYEQLSQNAFVHLISAELFDNGLDGLLEEAFDAITLDDAQKDKAAGILIHSLQTTLESLNPQYASLFAGEHVWKDADAMLDLTELLIELSADREISEGIPEMFRRGLPDSVNMKTVFGDIQAMQTTWWNEKTAVIVDGLTASPTDGSADPAAIALALIDKEFDFNTGILRQNAQALYGSAEEDFDAHDYYYVTTLILQTASVMGMSLSDQIRHVDFASLDETTANDVLVMIQSLIRMRIVAERCFCTYAERTMFDYIYVGLLNRINSARQSDHPSFYSYYTERLSELQAMKDTLLNTVGSSLQRPEAPLVSINFRTEKTNESFSADFEYSFNGATWTNAAGKPIDLHPAEMPKTLWVRRKANGVALAGNTAILRIPARGRLFSDPIVEYDGRTYKLSGLPAGDYRFGFASTSEELKLNQTMSLAQGETHLFRSSKYWLFLGVQKIGDDTSFDSVKRVIAVTIPDSWILDDATMRARGIPALTSRDEVIEHYAAKDMDAQLTDKNGDPIDVAGTGSQLHVNGKSYSVVIEGDVSGDGDINIIDCSRAEDHVMGDAQLQDEYLEAGALNSDADISIRDVNAMMNYAMNGAFE